MKINFKSAFVYVVLLVIQAASAFIVLPFFLNYLQPSDYGKYTLTLSLAILFQYFAGLSISDAVSVFYYQYVDDSEKAKKYIQNVLKFILLMSAVVAVFFWGFGNTIFNFFFSTNFTFWDNGIYALIMGALNSAVVPYQYYLRNSRMQKHFVIITLISTLSTIFFQSYVLTQTNFGLKGCYIAKILSSFIPFVYIIFHSGFLKDPRLNLSFIKPSLQYSIVTFAVLLLKWASTYVDRFFIAKYFSAEAVGVYGLLITLTSMVQFFFLAVGQAIQPDIFHTYTKNYKENSDYNTRAYDLFIVPTVMLSVVLLMSSLIITFVSSHKEYYVIKYYLPLCLISVLIETYHYKLILLLSYHKQPKPHLYSAIAVGLLSAICFVTLIPLFGIWGGILLSILSNAVRMVISLKFALPFLPNIRFVEEIKPFLPGIIFFTVALLFSFFYRTIYNQIILAGGIAAIGYCLITYKGFLTRRVKGLLFYFKQRSGGMYEN